MKIYISSDHNGVSLVNYLYNNLKDKYAIEKINLPNDPLDDYPLFAFELGKKVVKNNGLGILICGTGIGISIACNKVKGIRCARIYTIEDAKMCRLHNDANVIAFGSNYTEAEALKLVDTFLTTECLHEERHERRKKQINKFENGEYNVL